MEVVKFVFFLMVIISLKNEEFHQENKSTKCDKILMNSLQLQGYEHPLITEKPQICPYILENCCSPMDQVVILKMWQNYTMPLIKYKTNQLMHVYRNLFNMQRLLSTISWHKISLHYVKQTKLTYKKKFCFKISSKGQRYKFSLKKFKKAYKKRLRSRSLYQTDKDEVLNDLRFYFMDDKFKKNLSDKQKQTAKNILYINQRLRETFDNASDRFKDFVASRGKALAKKSEKLINKIAKKQRKLQRKLLEDLKEQSKYIDVPLKSDNDQHQKAIEQKIQSIKQKSQQARYLFLGALFGTNKGFDAMLKDRYKEMDELRIANDTFVTEEGMTALVYKNIGTAVKNKIERIKNEKMQYNPNTTSDKLPVEISNIPYHPLKKVSEGMYKKYMDSYIKKGKFQIEDFRHAVAQQSFYFDQYLKNLDEFLKKETFYMKFNYLQNSDTKPIKDEVIENMIDQFRNNNVGFFMQLPLPKILRIYKNRFPLYREDRIICQKKKVPFFRRFLLINQIKFKTCKRVYDNLSELADIDFTRYLIQFVQSVRSVLSIKKGVYCGVCDAKKQQFFDYENGIIYYSENMCRNFIGTYENFIKFTSIFMIEFADEIIQYINCIMTDSQDVNYPLKNSFSNQIRRIKYYHNCFENLDNPDMLKHCFFICKQIRINGASDFIEGDIKQLYLLLFKIIQFARQQKLDVSLNMQMDDKQLELFDHEFYKKDEEQAHEDLNDRQLDSEKDEIQIKSPNTRGTVTIYPKVPEVADFSQMENVFLNGEEGFDLVNYSSFANFEIKIEQFMKDNFFNHSLESSIAQGTLKAFFKTPLDRIQHFNQDIEMEIQEKPANLEDQPLKPIDVKESSEENHEVEKISNMTADPEINFLFN